MHFKIYWASLIVGRKLNLPFLLRFTLYLRAISKYKPPGGAIFEGAIEWRVNFLCYEFRGLIHRGAYLQNFTVYANSSGYGTDLPLSQTGHQISRIKWSFELFCALRVVCN